MSFLWIFWNPILFIVNYQYVGGIVNKKILIIYILSGVIFLQFQNCAQTSESFDNELDSIVDGIDPISVGQISFPQEKVSTLIDQTNVVIGICEQSGALISWKLVTSNQEVIERGMAECHLGSFEINLTLQEQIYCDKELSLKAALGAKASSEIIIETLCN